MKREVRKCRISVLLEVDNAGIKALDKFQNNVVKTQRWLNRNRLTVRAGHTELAELNKPTNHSKEQGLFTAY